jgi:hypothetical protein
VRGKNNLESFRNQLENSRHPSECLLCKGETASA